MDRRTHSEPAAPIQGQNTEHAGHYVRNVNDILIIEPKKNA